MHQRVYCADRLQAGIAPQVGARRDLIAIAISLVLVLALQIHLATLKSVNWDEFFHFSEIHARRAGLPVDPMQTPYTYLFGFVIDWPGTLIDHILTTRLLIVPFEALLLAAVVVAALRFVAIGPALAAGLLYLSAGYVFTQALSLRADIIAASLTMAAVALALHCRLSPLVLGALALLGTLAFISTIKTLLYAPVLLGVLILQRDALPRTGASTIKLALFGGAGVAAGVVVMAIVQPDIPAYLVDKLTRAAARMFGAGWLPQPGYLAKQVGFAIPFMLSLAAFVGWLLHADPPRDHRAALALFALPALWPLIYFNAYPYFFAFMLPPVAVAVAPVVAIAARRYGMGTLAAICVLNAVLLWALEPRATLATQRAFQTELRAIFPDPVRYIDETGIISDYPRAVPHYASGWALAIYHAAGVPEYRQRVLEAPTPLLIANSLALASVFSSFPSPERLLPADEAFLRAQYLPHAGMIHVAGKRLAPGEHRVREMFAIPGNYRVEGGPLLIEGRVVPAGAIVTLAQRRYELHNASQTPVTLRWAAAGAPRPSAIGLADMFTDF